MSAPSLNTSCGGRWVEDGVPSVDFPEVAEAHTPPTSDVAVKATGSGDCACGKGELLRHAAQEVRHMQTRLDALLTLLGGGGGGGCGGGGVRASVGVHKKVGDLVRVSAPAALPAESACGGGSGVECPICFEDLCQGAVGEEAPHQLQCGHVFHTLCLCRAFGSTCVDHRCGVCGKEVTQQEVRAINRAFWRRKMTEAAKRGKHKAVTSGSGGGSGAGRGTKLAPPLAPPPPAARPDNRYTMSQLDGLMDPDSQLNPFPKRPKTAGGVLHRTYTR